MDIHESETLVMERPIAGTLLIEIPAIASELKNPCRRYWLVDKPNGPLSHGVCKYCQEERDFANSPPQFTRLTVTKRNFGIPNRKQLVGW